VVFVVVTYPKSIRYEQKKKIIERVKASRLLLNMMSIASANIVSQVVILATTPILTRLFTPENFGVAALFLSALRLAGSISTWRFDRTVPNASTNLMAVILCCWGVLFSIGICLVITCLVYIELSNTRFWAGSSALGKLLYLLPIAVFLTGLVQLGAAWYARGTILLHFSRSIIVYSIVYTLVAILGGWLGLKDSGLILAAVSALLGQVTTLVYLTRDARVTGKATKSRIYCSFKRHINAATTTSGVAFFNTLSLTAPVFLLSQVYTVAELGIYALMTRLITTPLGVLTKSLSISFWSRAAELGREKNYKELHRLYIRVCAVMGIPALLVTAACLIGSQIIAPVLGDQWLDAGPILTAIIPLVVGISIASPTNHLWVIEKQSYQFIADGTRMLLMVICIIAADMFDWSFGVAVLALSISSFVGHMLLVLIHLLMHRRLISAIFGANEPRA
jgi:O-antigen/teichoic acid export membrane protein